MAGNRTQDGLSLAGILKLAIKAGIEVRQGGKHPYNLLYPNMRPCPLATSTHGKRMVAPWLAQALGKERKQVYEALQRGYWD
ncbi:MAG: hypothetical protein Q8Q31_04050 [Nanoarchaeota archaeon]|nr:hypothetical protein [Nanoarchaeota archaeon]